MLNPNFGKLNCFRGFLPPFCPNSQRFPLGFHTPPGFWVTLGVRCRPWSFEMAFTRWDFWWRNRGSVSSYSYRDLLLANSPVLPPFCCLRWSFDASRDQRSRISLSSLISTDGIAYWFCVSPVNRCCCVDLERRPSSNMNFVMLPWYYMKSSVLRCMLSTWYQAKGYDSIRIRLTSSVYHE